MKRLPKILIQKPILLGLIAFAINLFISSMPVLLLHDKHIQHYKETFALFDLIDHKFFNEQQTIVYSALFYAFIFSIILSILITFLAIYLKKSYQEVESLSHFDGLTGLYNRLMFVNIFQKELQKMKRGSHSLFLVIVDIDDFKPINDTYGHLVGDEAIKTTANTLKNLLRESDTVARFGGDEFIIGVVDKNEEVGSIVVNRILSEFNHKSIPITRKNDLHELQINLSIGYTAYKMNDDFKTMLQRADQALYISKEAGKNTATFLA